MRAAGASSAHAIEKVRCDDRGGFEAVYREYKHNVYALCLRKTSDVADAEDLTQEVFLQVHRKVNSLRDEAAFKGWLFRVTMNTILMHFRKRRMDALPLNYLGDTETSPILDTLQALSVVCEPIERIALARAIGGLPKCRRAAVVLHDIKGMSHREVALSLGVSLNTAKSNLCRARRQLRGILRD
jgi:RNA polymerase sigma-70 factor (ECF subfamily)